MKWKISILIGLLLLCVGICAGMMLTRSCQKPKEIVKETIKTDTLTLVRIDTITQVLPQPYKVVVRDTIYINDTINGNIFVQQIKEYKDSTYYARISGINAYLEEIKVFPRTEYKYITTTEKVYQKPKKWGIGVQVGYGVGKNGIQPYVGVGIQYDFLRF
jgi:hypothetical protein